MVSQYANRQESGMAQATFQIDYDDEVGFAAKRWLFNAARDKAQGKGAPLRLSPVLSILTTPMWRGPNGGIFIQMKTSHCRLHPRSRGSRSVFQTAYGRD